MSPPWSKPLDIERLADSGAEVDFAVPLAELPRLRSRIAGLSGEARGRVHFRRDTGFAVADVILDGTAVVTCQRCLQPMDELVSSAVGVALIATEADVNRVPEHLEPVLAANGRISIGELVEEELLLALPIVSSHAQSAACAVRVDPGEERSSGEQPQQTQRPFEKLAELFKRS